MAGRLRGPSEIVPPHTVMFRVYKIIYYLRSQTWRQYLMRHLSLIIYTLKRTFTEKIVSTSLVGASSLGPDLDHERPLAIPFVRLLPIFELRISL